MFATRTNWPLVPNRLSRALEERRQAGRPILDLTESNPTRCGFTYDTPEILAALNGSATLDYQPQAKGWRKAREAVAEYYAGRGVVVDPEQVFLTTGTSEAYAYVFRLLANPGDVILAPRPSYPLLDFLARLNDVQLGSYSLLYHGGWRIDAASIASALASSSAPARALLVFHPNNPTGSFVRAEEEEFLLEVCRRHRLALVADEVFADYRLSPPPASDTDRPVASHAATGQVLTFTLSGLSKISALPQMKLAWIVTSGPDDQRRQALARLEIIADTYLSVSAPLSHALPRLLATRGSVQSQIERRLRDNRAALDQELAAGNVTRLENEGGWYAILRLATTGHEESDEDRAVELVIRDGVLVHPGHFYDFTEEGYLVLSLLPPPAVFVEGVRKLVARLSA